MSQLLIDNFNNLRDGKIFEIPVVNNHTGEDKVSVWKLSCDEKGMYATPSIDDFTVKSKDWDEDLTIDEHLHELYVGCYLQIMDSDVWEDKDK